MADFKDGERVTATRDIINSASGDHPDQLLARKGQKLVIYDISFETPFPWVVQREDGRIFSVKTDEIASVPNERSQP